MKGIILAGGKGTRLYPLTASINKQLLPVYNKPMIYYPLSILMLAGIRDILIISTPNDLISFQKFLGDGKIWGINFQYAEQPEPRGLADAFIIGEDFIAGDQVGLILGDNLFYGSTLPERLRNASALTKGGKVFAYKVRDPRGYAVVDFWRDEGGRLFAKGIEEKPTIPKSSFAIPGLYFYDNHVIDIAKSLEPSRRGELEITDVNKIYLERGELIVDELGRGVAWLDVGTHETLLQASHFVQVIEERQGMMISCPEEIAYRLGHITLDELDQLTQTMGDNFYKQYLNGLLALE